MNRWPAFVVGVLLVWSCGGKAVVDGTPSGAEGGASGGLPTHDCPEAEPAEGQACPQQSGKSCWYPAAGGCYDVLECVAQTPDAPVWISAGQACPD
jgi:hypothetical protein